MRKANLLVGQSGGCTAVINQTLAGVIEAARHDSSIGYLWGMRYGVQGLLKNAFIDLGTLNKKERISLRQTPSSALGSCRYKIGDKECNVIFKRLKRSNIRYLLLIGGNDTAQTLLRIAQHAQEKNYELYAIAIPKTIDNDLPCMDHTPGYGSAATFVASITQEAGRDTEAMKYVDPVKIIEVMGRNSGWLVAAAALGKRSIYDAPHLLYFPERSFNERQFVHDVEHVYRRIGYVVMVVSETIRDRRSRRIGERKAGIRKDSFGHQYVEGAAAKLCRLVERKLKIRARFDKPGTIQRMSMRYISPVDQREAYMVGTQGVRLAMRGKSGIIVTLRRISHRPYRCTTGYVPIEKIAGVERYVPRNFINTKGNFVTKAFIDYARPLVGTLPNFVRLS